jgi:hypothetical protein
MCGWISCVAGSPRAVAHRRRRARDVTGWWGRHQPGSGRRGGHRTTPRTHAAQQRHRREIDAATGAAAALVANRSDTGCPTPRAPGAVRAPRHPTGRRRSAQAHRRHHLDIHAPAATAAAGAGAIPRTPRYPGAPDRGRPAPRTRPRMGEASAGSVHGTPLSSPAGDRETARPTTEILRPRAAYGIAGQSTSRDASGDKACGPQPAPRNSL